MKVISILLVMASISIIVFGLSNQVSAVQETTIIALAIFVAVLARIAQATAHHEKVTDLLKPSED